MREFDLDDTIKMLMREDGEKLNVLFRTWKAGMHDLAMKMEKGPRDIPGIQDSEFGTTLARCEP